jgi:hypothetical protein
VCRSRLGFGPVACGFPVGQGGRSADSYRTRPAARHAAGSADRETLGSIRSRISGGDETESPPGLSRRS